MNLDADGQPTYQYRANLANNLRKSIDHMVGLCRGILCDGEVNAKEAQIFAQWVKLNKELLKNSIFGAVISRVERIYGDGKIDDEEREELAEIMRTIGGYMEKEAGIESKASAFPLCQPAPAIRFTGSEFVITGKCVFGKRASVADEITKIGGLIAVHPTHSTKYLLIGHFASRDWIHESYGRKIERAMQLKAERTGIAIISEAHWLDELKNACSHSSGERR